MYAAPDLGEAVDRLHERFGVRAEPGGKHVGLGTHNALLALGATTYLEVIAPDPDQPSPERRRPFGLDDSSDGRLAGWAVACDDIDAAIEHARTRGYDPGDAVEMQRVGAAGNVLKWRLTLNARDGGAVPFLIAWGDSEHPARSAPRGLALEAFEIEHPDVGSLTSTLAALDARVTVRAASGTALVARVRGAFGVRELR